LCARIARPIRYGDHYYDYSASAHGREQAFSNLVQDFRRYQTQLLRQMAPRTAMVRETIKTQHEGPPHMYALAIMKDCRIVEAR